MYWCINWFGQTSIIGEWIDRNQSTIFINPFSMGLLRGFISRIKWDEQKKLINRLINQCKWHFIRVKCLRLWRVGCVERVRSSARNKGWGGGIRRQAEKEGYRRRKSKTENEYDEFHQKSLKLSFRTSTQTHKKCNRLCTAQQHQTKYAKWSHSTVIIISLISNWTFIDWYA